MTATASQINLAEAIETLSEDVSDESASSSLLQKYTNQNARIDAILNGSVSSDLSAQRASLASQTSSILKGTASAGSQAENLAVSDLANDILSQNQSGSANYDFAIRASQTGSAENPLVSPAGIVFAAFATSEAFPLQSGFKFDFDDSGSGTYPTSEAGSKNTKFGGPMAFHTFLVADGDGLQTFEVLCKKKDENGVETLGSVTVYVTDQASAFDADDTILISNTLNSAADWPATVTNDSGITLPSGATQYVSISAMVSGEGANISDKRILLYAGDDFSAEDLDIVTGNHGIRIGYFGQLSNGEPEIGAYRCGVKASGSSFFDIDDTEISSAISTYGYAWPVNIVMHNIRTPTVDFAMSFQHCGVHELDMDFNAQASGGEIAFKSGDLSWRSTTTDLTRTNVPFPKGAYISDCNLYGSSTSAPLLNINGVNSACPTWLGITGTKCRYAEEHNIRIHGAQHFAIHNNDLLGDHQAGSKHNITMRASGYSITGDNSVLTRGDNGMGSASDKNDYQYLPASRWGCIETNYCTPGEDTTQDWNIYVGPTNTTSDMRLQDIIVRDNLVDDEGLGGGARISMAARLSLVTETRFDAGYANTGVTNAGGNYSFDDLSDNDVLNGVVQGTIANALTTNGENLFDTRTTAGYVLPTPSAPR